MEKYEKPGERLVSKVPNKEYKDNYDGIFGVMYKVFYSDGSQKMHKFPDDAEAEWFLHNEGDHLINFIKL